MLTPCDLFSWVKTANKMRSMLVLSWKVPIGLVRRLTSRKRRSTALVTGMRMSVLMSCCGFRIVAYGATIRDRGTGSTKVRAGRSVR